MTRVNGNPHSGRYGYAHDRSKDNGYTKICPNCCVRYGLRDDFVNRERNIDMVLCSKCKPKQAPVKKHIERMGPNRE
jgi:hypothetical protein